MEGEVVFVSVQGIKSKTGQTTDYAVKYMFDVYDYKYHEVDFPARAWWNVRYYAKKDGKALAANIEQFLKSHGPCKIIFIAHSAGTLVASHAMKFLAKKRIYVYAAWLFRGAMSWMWEFPRQTKIISIYSPNDSAIKAGRRMLFHAFGAAGNYGHFWADQVKMSRCDGHSADFSSQNWYDWSVQLDEFAKNAA